MDICFFFRFFNIIYNINPHVLYIRILMFVIRLQFQNKTYLDYEQISDSMDFAHRYFGQYLIDLGVFRNIKTQGIDKCRLIVLLDGGY